MTLTAAKETRNSYFSSVILSELEYVFQQILSSSMIGSTQEKIDQKTLSRFLKSTLKYAHRNSEIDEAIWEIDEDYDGKICWDEFKTACIRCIFDDQAREPQQMFNFILFTIFSGGSPILIESQLKHLLFLRYGKEHASRKLERGFGTQGPYDVTLGQFIRGMNKL